MKKNLVAGEWVGASDASENRNPADRADLIGHYAQGSAETVQAAVEAARGALAD